MSTHIKEQLAVLNQQAKDLAAVYHGAASGAGISDSEFWVWYALLVLEGEYSQQDICDIWSLPKQTVNSVITNLTKKSLLYLEAVPGTRNRKIIRMSPEGRVHGESIVTRVYEAEQCALEKMSEAERGICIALLGKYIVCLKEELDKN